jgi:hypothetical protein
MARMPSTSCGTSVDGSPSPESVVPDATDSSLDEDRANWGEREGHATTANVTIENTAAAAHREGAIGVA